MRPNQIAMVVMGGLLGMAVMGWASEARLGVLEAKVDKLERQSKRLRSVVQVRGDSVRIKAAKNLTLQAGSHINLDSTRRMNLKSDRGVWVNAENWIVLDAGKTLALRGATTEYAGRTCVTKP